MAMIDPTSPSEVAARSMRCLDMSSTIGAKGRGKVKETRQEYHFSDIPFWTPVLGRLSSLDC